MSQRLLVPMYAKLSCGRLIRIITGAEGEVIIVPPGGAPVTDPNAPPPDPNAPPVDDPTKPVQVTQEEYDRLLARMQAADRAKSQAELKVKEYEDKGKGELELAQSRVAELEAANAELSSALTTAKRDQAFLVNNTVKWHDPKLAMQQVEWDGVVNEDSGAINDAVLKKAIEALAKQRPYLVATEDTGKPAGSPSGAPIGNGKPNDPKAVNREALMKKYPALRH